MRRRQRALRNIQDKAKALFIGLGLVVSMLLTSSVDAQNLTIRVNRTNHHDFGNFTNAGLVSQPVTDDGVAVFRVRARKHNTQQRDLQVVITVPSVPEVQSWNVAYTPDTDDPASSTPTTLTTNITVPSRASVSGNNAFYYFYVYTDVNFGSTSAAYVETITCTATLSEI